MIIPAGTWVQIESVILTAGQRAPQLPADTQGTPLVMWVKGWLQSEASLGEAVEVETVIGRRLCGKLVEVNPCYQHTFGAPLAPLQQAGERARRLLASGVSQHG